MARVSSVRTLTLAALLRQELTRRCWTQSDLAALINKPLQAINEIMLGRRSLTPEMALLFQAALGIEAEEWLRLDNINRLSRIRGTMNEGDVEKRVQIYNLAPVDEMMALGWIPKTSDVSEMEAHLLRFYEANSLDDIERAAARYRTSTAYSPRQAALNAWVRKAELSARDFCGSRFRPELIPENIDALVQCSRDADPYHSVRKHLSNMGIALVHVPHLKQTYVDGAAFYAEGKTPTIAVSLRYNRIDNLFFTLMHELAHWHRHIRKDSSVIVDEKVQDRKDTTEETEANMLAGEWLLPEAEYRAFVRTYAGHFTEERVREFARNMLVHPSIVVGRLQHDRRLPFSAMRRLLKEVTSVPS